MQPYYVYKGEEAKLNIVVANTGVGHDFPGGTIDINEAWLALRVVDAEGQLVYSSGDVNANGDLSTGTYSTVRSQLTEKEIWCGNTISLT